MLLERGFTAPQERRGLQQVPIVLLNERRSVPPSLPSALAYVRWSGTRACGVAELNRAWRAFDDEFAARAKADATVRRLATIPGIGALNATGLAVAIGNAATFERGRDLAAWLGLVRRQATT